MPRQAINLVPDRTDSAYRPSRRTLRRILDGTLPISYGDRLARITMLEHGGHRRPVIHRGSKHSRFRFTSRKTGLTQLGEGPGEEFLAYLNEIDGRKADYQFHPCEIEVVGQDGPFRYRPDGLTMSIDGSVELFEVKRTHDDLDDPAYRDKLAVIKEVARRCGWRFRVLYNVDVFGTTKDIRRERKRNVEGIFSRRSLGLSVEQARAADRIVAWSEPLTWRDVRQEIEPGDPLTGDAVIECMLARGMLLVDLDQRFHGGTVLTPVAPYRGASAIRL